MKTRDSDSFTLRGYEIQQVSITLCGVSGFPCQKHLQRQQDQPRSFTTEAARHTRISSLLPDIGNPLRCRHSCHRRSSCLRHPNKASNLEADFFIIQPPGTQIPSYLNLIAKLCAGSYKPVTWRVSGDSIMHGSRSPHRLLYARRHPSCLFFSHWKAHGPCIRN